MPASHHSRHLRPRAVAAAARLAVCLAAPAVLLGGCADGSGGAGAADAGQGQAQGQAQGRVQAAVAPAGTQPVTPLPAAPASTPVAPATAAETTTAETTTAPTPVRRPKPVNHCARNTARQLVLVSLRTQHAWFCARSRTVYDTPVTSGMSGQYTRTPTGNYHIQGRNRHTTLTLNTGRQYHVQYWIPFDAPLYGFHDSSWQHFPYGSALYKSRGSHGCVHLPLAAMKHLYEWVHIGASVSIHR